MIAMRGRHTGLSLWISGQTVRSIAPQVRRNAHAFFLGKFTNAAETQAFSEELSALTPGGKQGIMALYNHALKKGPHSFLYCNVREGTFYDSDWNEISLTSNEPESDEEGLDDDNQDRGRGSGHPGQTKALGDR